MKWCEKNNADPEYSSAKPDVQLYPGFVNSQEIHPEHTGNYQTCLR
jgi:hypothetical protein